MGRLYRCAKAVAGNVGLKPFAPPMLGYVGRTARRLARRRLEVARRAMRRVFGVASISAL